MKQIVMCYGLPASGKSTFAREFIKGKKDWVRVNNDELGGMMFGETFAEGRSKQIDKMREDIIQKFMEERLNIIVDNTNLHPKHKENYTNLVNVWNVTHEHDNKPELYKFDIKDFSNVPLKDCIMRNKKRDNPVPDKVIYMMHKQYLQKASTGMLVQDPTLPKALLVDLDGTVCDLNGRIAYDYKQCVNDLPNQFVVDLVKRYQTDHTIIFVSGRNNSVRAETVQWLKNQGLLDGKHQLHLRTEEKESDIDYKPRIFNQHVKDKFFVSFAIEDRSRVVQCYRHLIGVPCIQVADGDF